MGDIIEKLEQIEGYQAEQNRGEVLQWKEWN